MEKLFQTGRIGVLTIKNRAVMPPMEVLYGEVDGSVGQRAINYYEERARGGVGLIIVEATAVDEINNSPVDYQLRLTSNQYVSGFQQLAEAIHRHDCHAFVQLHHYGSKSSPTAAGAPWTSSDIPAVPGGTPGHRMTVQEIKILEQRFIDAAVRAQKAGFDGVELAGTHGYLLHQFLSPYYNDRTDLYGGSVENRCRFYTELIQGIHAACGKAFPVSVRFPGDECTPDIPGTLTVTDGVEIAKILEAAGADVLDVSNGNNFNPNANCEPYSYRPGWKKHIAKSIHDAVSIPVMATNTIKSPEFAEQLLMEDVSDFVCLGRALIADPQFVKKAACGDSISIRQCMGCLYCREQLYASMPIKCAVNPRTGCEYIYPREAVTDSDGKTAAVIGGGPAGMEAAKQLAERGYAVTLFEAADRLGGSLNLADRGAFKEQITCLCETMEEELRRLGVDIQLGKKVAPETIKTCQYDQIILACGAKPIIPNVPGVDSSNVVTSHQIISGEKNVFGKVAVVGAGMVGLECAEKLCAADCKVTLIDMQEKVGNGIFSIIADDLMSRILPYDPEILTSCALREITADGAKVVDLKTGAEKEVHADYVVLSLGVAPDRKISEGFRAAFGNLLIVGDSRAPGRIPHAIRDAYIKTISD